MVDEIIDNQIPSGMPDSIYGEGSSLIPNYNMSNPFWVNQSLLGISGQMAAVGWDIDKKLKAYYEFRIDLPINGRAGLGSRVIDLYPTLYGDNPGGAQAYQFFCPYPPSNDPDPTGGSSPSGGLIKGLPTFPDDPQITLIGYLIAAMDAAPFPDGKQFIHTAYKPLDDPDSPLFGVPTAIYIEAKEGGVDYNDFSGIGNVVGGGQFIGPSRYGGYDLYSRSGDTVLHVKMWNDLNGNFTFITGFPTGPRGNPVSELTNSDLTETVFFGRSAYYCFASPHNWIVFPANYDSYTAKNARENEIGTSDYHLAGIYVPPAQANGSLTRLDTINHGYGWDDPLIRNPIVFAGFMMSTNRAFLTEDTRCATCVNDFFKIGQFPGLDCGVTYLTYNTRYHEAGTIVTTVGRTIMYSAIVALTEGNSFFNREHDYPWVAVKSQVYGFTYCMYLTTETVPLGTIIEQTTGQYYLAYRTQSTPCEATLWLKTASPSEEA